ncbi:DUF4956 domain-containing protein [Clostridium sp. 1001271B_151109_B4]|uniref:DUF4956 domain-containing protein n=1 Tax=Clostridium sp. 1001271B_151109_B4 TaxID=2787148 RepID=UPI0018A9A918|nr:DUF4956 domain-containing protein [Clostridium sp. 1001271B_151109_B4]
MLETIISSTNGESFTLANALLVIGSSIVLGLVISLAYMYTHKKEGYAPGFTITLIMLPVIIAIIILLVGNNVARAFSLAGAFSIIRFRSAPGDPKDISYIFFTLAVGLACGMGYIGYGVIVTVILCIIMIVLDKIKFAVPKTKNMRLKILVPEDLNYEGVFDKILDSYSTNWATESVKTKDFGALFEISYKIHLKEGVSQKKLIDELRCKNGNLTIALTSAGLEEKVYL